MRFAKFFPCLLAASSHCFAQGGDPYHGRVVFIAQADRQPINPFTVYQGRIRYFIDPAARSMAITVGGHDYSIDMDTVTREAIGEWQRLLGSNLIFSPVTAEDTADLIINISDTGTTPPVIGVGIPRSTYFSQAKLSYYWRSFQTLLGSDDFMRDATKYVKNGATPQETTTNILRFLARMTAKHEIGHVLGFGHPDNSRNESLNPHVFRSVIVFDTFIRPTLPIMTPRTRDYMRSLFEAAGRQVEAEDIDISVQERAALDELYRDTQNHCSCCLPSRSKKYDDFLEVSETPADGDTCPTFRYIPPYGLPFSSLLLD